MSKLLIWDTGQESCQHQIHITVNDMYSYCLFVHPMYKFNFPNLWIPLTWRVGSLSHSLSSLQQRARWVGKQWLNRQGSKQASRRAIGKEDGSMGSYLQHERGQWLGICIDLIRQLQTLHAWTLTGPENWRDRTRLSSYWLASLVSARFCQNCLAGHCQHRIGLRLRVQGLDPSKGS